MNIGNIAKTFDEFCQAVPSAFAEGADLSKLKLTCEEGESTSVPLLVFCSEFSLLELAMAARPSSMVEVIYVNARKEVLNAIRSEAEKHSGKIRIRSPKDLFGACSFLKNGDSACFHFSITLNFTK